MGYSAMKEIQMSCCISWGDVVDWQKNC